MVYINRLHNKTEDIEDVHADPKKAKSIASLLSAEGDSVVVSKVFGPNIKRIKKFFVCVIIKNDSIEQRKKNK